MRDMRGQGVVRLGGIIAVGLVLALAGASLAAPPVGQPAPNFTLSLLDGRKVSLREFKGKPVVVNFWHSG